MCACVSWCGCGCMLPSLKSPPLFTSSVSMRGNELFGTLMIFEINKEFVGETGVMSCHDGINGLE